MIILRRRALYFYLWNSDTTHSKLENEHRFGVLHVNARLIFLLLIWHQLVDILCSGFGFNHLIEEIFPESQIEVSELAFSDGLENKVSTFRNFINVN